MKLINSFFNGEIKVIEPTLFSDDRGFFQESFNLAKFKDVGIDNDFIQDNHSWSKSKGTIRGLHFQKGPMAQAKLVRVIKGEVLDVFVDVRKDSPTFGQYEEVIISAENNFQVYIPRGFAHGFCTLTDDCHFLYKVDQYYSPECNFGLIWNDTDINILWPNKNPILSKQDLKWGSLKDYSAEIGRG